MLHNVNERLDKVEIVSVICAKIVKGDGTQENPVVGLSRFFDLKGNLIAECVDQNSCEIGKPSNYPQFLQLLQRDSRK